MTREKKGKKRGKKYLVELSGTSIFFWSMGIFFALVWMFALGVFVGRGVLQEKIQGQDEKFFSWDLVQTGNTSEEAGEDSATNGKAKEDWDYSIHDELVEKTGNKGEKENRKLPEKTVRLQEKRSIEEPDELQPDGAKKGGAAEGLFAVQLASFVRKKQAEDLAEKLRSRGYEAYCMEAVVDGHTHYRVRCGSFQTRSQAEEFRMRVKQKESFRDCYIVEKGK